MNLKLDFLNDFSIFFEIRKSVGEFKIRKKYEVASLGFTLGCLCLKLNQVMIL